jgi:hypothetical protein
MAWSALRRRARELGLEPVFPGDRGVIYRWTDGPRSSAALRQSKRSGSG